MVQLVGCPSGKLAYDTKHEANLALDQMAKRDSKGRRGSCYICLDCGQHHLSRHAEKAGDVRKKQEYKKRKKLHVET